MRGERHRPTETVGPRHGSSPHARGTPERPSFVGAHRRFIPACAGNAPAPYAQSRYHPVHPRMRGERLDALTKYTAESGSSPHARGTPAVILCKSKTIRFIPACAGNAPPSGNSRVRPPVHPRMRGERSGFGSRTPAGSGSSPHARGTRTASSGECLPAAVHPRMRGERLRMASSSRGTPGSSPHARGTLRGVDFEVAQERFIPACAGNAEGAASGAAPPPVHPRMRGERYVSPFAAVGVYGSSPHARGTRITTQASSGRVRFIPACAGNASSLLAA